MGVTILMVYQHQVPVAPGMSCSARVLGGGGGVSMYLLTKTLRQFHVLPCVGGSGLWWLELRLEPRTSQPYRLSRPRVSDFISLCLGFPICPYLLRLPCRINEVMYVLVLALHLAHCQGKANLCSENGQVLWVPFPGQG